MLKRLVILGCCFALCPQVSWAVIVAGTLGTGNNNNTQSGLDGYLATSPYDPFPYWQNLVRVADASGVYLGYNASTQRGWVLSANHVTKPTSITVAGNAYTVTGTGTRVGLTDLRLYEIGGGVSDPDLPSLPSVPLSSALAVTGEFSLMFGRGFTNNNSAPYTWGTPGTNDANGMRWATNTVEGLAVVNIGTQASPNNQLYTVVDFDGPGDPGVTAYDGQGALGDSGGGLFIFRNGQWVLAGIAHFVDDGPDFLEASPTGDNVTNPSQHGDFTAYSDVYWNAAAIQGITGALVPELSTLWLVLPGGILLARRRR